MNKIALITDLHFGHKKGNDVFLDSQMRFFREQFIPYLKENNISNIGILGDVFDNRVNINTKVFKRVYQLFNEDFADFEIYVFPGNHDLYYTSTLDVHSLHFLTEFKNVVVVEDAKVVDVCGRKIFMCPWIVDEDEFVRKISSLEKDVDVCFGHFEISGFNMFKNKMCEHGISSNVFYDKFKLTVSGHFHTRSKMKKQGSEILYMGNPFHMTRNDIGDDRGFCVLDLDDLSYTLHDNVKSIRYNTIKYPNTPTKEIIFGNNVDILIDYDENYNEEDVQKYILEVESYKPAYTPLVRIINKFISTGDCDTIEILSCQELLKEYVEHLDIPNKEKMHTLLNDLYNECKGE